MGVDAGTPPGLWDRVRSIAAEEVARFARSGFLRNASVTDGGLTLRGGFLKLLAAAGGPTTFYVGPVTPALPDGSLQPGMIVKRNDDTTVLAMYDPNPAAGDYFQFLAWYDRAGNNIFSDDTDSGQGIARPYVPGTFYRSRNTDWPTTFSGTFETMWRARMPKQQPKLLVRSWSSHDTVGATGEMRVMINGVQFGQTIATAAGSITETSFGGVQAVPGAHMSQLTIEIQARMVSGMGSIATCPSQLQGQQS